MDSIIGAIVAEVMDEVVGDYLNRYEIELTAQMVRRKLVKLHPRQLALALLEIQAARLVRYNIPQPDYNAALQACVKLEPRGREREDPDTTQEQERIQEFGIQLTLLRQMGQEAE